MEVKHSHSLIIPLNSNNILKNLEILKQRWVSCVHFRTTTRLAGLQGAAQQLASQLGGQESSHECQDVRK